jgi:RNA polymerase sigma factor (sigma-70 family)
MIRYAIALTGDSDRAEDVVARVFMKLIRGSTPLVRITKPYICTALVNVWRRELRRERHIVRSGHPTSTPGEDYERLEARIDLERAVAILPPKCAATLEARMHGMTNREIAARFGVSEKTVSAHLARARVIVRNHRGRRKDARHDVVFGSCENAEPSESSSLRGRESDKRQRGADSDSDTTGHVSTGDHDSVP